MSCPGYQPAFGKGQLDGSTYGSLNCTAWSGARAATDDSCGRYSPTSAQVRLWTGDTDGGTNLAQIDLALRTHIGVDLDTRYSYPWSSFVKRVNGGASAILQGWYKPIRDSRFRGSESFYQNHAMLVTPGLVVMDPLADGRRENLYRYHGEAYPAALLKAFAGQLNVAGNGYRALGSGLVYAAFTRDNEPAYRVVIHPTPPAKIKAFFVYAVKDGKIVGRTEAHTAGFSALCDPPRLTPWPAQGRSVSLVRLTSSSRKGQYVNAKTAQEIP